MILAQINIQDKFAPAKNVDSIGKLLTVALPLMMTGAGLLALGMSLYGAFMYLTHGDNPEELKKAKLIIVYSVIGLFIVIVSFVAVQVIGKILNIPKII